MRESPPIQNDTSAYAVAVLCPACRSSSTVTKAKSPDADSYWRCIDCGEVWNAGRTQNDRRRSYRWP